MDLLANEFITSKTGQFNSDSLNKILSQFNKRELDYLEEFDYRNPVTFKFRFEDKKEREILEDMRKDIEGTDLKRLNNP